MCYAFNAKFQRISLLFGVYSTFKLSKYSKVHPALFLIMHLIFDWLAEKYFEAPLKSDLTKTEPAGPVSPLLYEPD